MWTAELAAWYEEHGRHRLPWRLTRDPWAVLVSEVMLQQTSVARVLPRWDAFLQRWPTPQACAAAARDDVLREWDGLGYPRRAVALHRCAAAVAEVGWPQDEKGLRALPGIGVYTARALLAFAFDAPDVPPPRDVNLGRVAARAALGVEPDEVPPKRVDEVLAASRPAGVSPREHAYALFDLGATVCRARRPACVECPLGDCASRARLSEGVVERHRPPRQARYAGSMRQLRGEVLRSLLGADPPATWAQLRARIASVPAAVADPAALERAVAGLQSDGLLGRDWPDG